jgi:type IV/VI secretion system ImpK/VasF family protein
LFNRNKKDEQEEASIQALLAAFPPAKSEHPDADALWDEPAVAESSAVTPPALEAGDFAAVWSPRDAASPESEPAAAPAQRPGLFGRFFTKKQSESQEGIDREREAAQTWASDLAEAREREPADADFADDFAASSAPGADDFAEPAKPVPPSLDHSSSDAASLAALLDSTPSSETTEHAPALEEIEPIADPVPLSPQVIDPAKKPGFFSGMLKRVSRAQFIPPAPREPDPPPALELESAPAVSDTETPAAQPTTSEDDSLFDTVPTPMAAVPPVSPPPPRSTTPEELESTLRFPPFRDARDDFADEEPFDDKGRATEKVTVPPEDEGEKTDEFELVPPPSRGEDGTTETRQVTGLWGRIFGEKVAAAAAAGAPISPADDKIPFVLAKFRTFYNEVIRDKHQKSDVISGFATAVLSAPASDMADPEFAAQLLSKRLSEMLELQAAESNWTGGDAARYYPEAQYAMVALADETFATIDWPGRSAWHKHMLEPRMFGTRGADIEFFKRIDKLLKDPNPEKGARDLARLYLMVIASGFRGKFRVPNLRRPLAEYRRRLYEFSHVADPLELYARERRIFPSAVEHTIASRAGGRFTPAQKWMGTAIVLLVLYLGISHYAWSRLSADLKDIMTRIESPENPGKTP